MFTPYFLANNSSSRESLNHLSCIAFLSATDASIDAVKQELAKPKYGSYQLCESLERYRAEGRFLQYIVETPDRRDGYC
jgi:hypothetical protein